MIPLSIHSGWSLHDGLHPPEVWVAHAATHGLPALGIADLNTMAGLVPFIQAAQEAGITPICGATVTLDETDPGLVLLVRSQLGWGSLSLGLSHWRFGRRKEGWSAWARGAEGLIALPGSTRWLMRVLQEDAWRQPGSCFSRVFPEPDTPSRRHEQSALLALARDRGIPLVAATDPVAIDPSGLPAHRILRALRLDTTVHRLSADQVAPPTAVWPSPPIVAQMRAFPGAIENTYRIAEACSFVPSMGTPLFPPAPNKEEPTARLRALTQTGLRHRYGESIPIEALRRTERELKVISDMGYASYFLVVHDIVQEAGRRGLPTLGRGSVANSTVAYALGITHVDPVAHHLFFERFLNPERLDPPDIDLDLPWNRREEIVQYVFDRYGENHAAMVGAFGTFQTRGMVREIGRALGIPPEWLNKMAKRLPGGGIHRLEDAIGNEHPSYRGLPLDQQPWRQILALGRRINGLPSHFGMHPCGIAVAGAPIREVIAIAPAPGGHPTTDCAMGPAEDLGLIKIDLLGNRSMSALTDCLEVLGIRRLEDPEGGLSPDQTIEDPATCDLIARGDTIGCFYIESPSMRGVLKRLDCRDFPTLVAASSIIRPGVNQGGLLDNFIRRHRGWERSTFLDERLRPFLEETHGILVYQEQVIQAASTVAGMSLGEADLLRRAMGKKRHWEDLLGYHDHFMSGALGGGMSPQRAEALWKQMESFAGYAFCKAHSASFARLSFQMAWLRAHHPALFFAAILANQGGFYHPQVYMEEARRLGIQILPPSVASGRWETEALNDRTIRIGLQYVSSLSTQHVEAILQARPFRGFSDFLNRAALNREAASMLVLSGATDMLPGGHPTRTDRLWQIEGHRPTHTAGLFDSEHPGQPLRDENETVEQRIRREIESTGLSIADHPIRLFRARLLPYRGMVTPAQRASRFPDGVRVRCIGLQVARKSLSTKRGEPMTFLSLSDRSGIIETVLFPDAFHSVGPAIRAQGPWLAEGEMKDGTMVVERIRLVGQEPMGKDIAASA